MIKHKPVNHCIVLLGSNVEPYSSMPVALEALRGVDAQLLCLPQQLTAAAGGGGKPPYMNQLVSLKTTLSANELTARFKELEKKLGRTPEDKLAGRVIIDIDLVYFNDQLLKPFEASLPYVVEGVDSLKNL